MSLSRPESEEQDTDNCQEFVEFQQIVDTVAVNIYDPKRLGDWQALRQKYNCQLHSTDDLIDFANKTLQDIGDPHTNLLRPASDGDTAFQLAVKHVKE